MKLAVIPARGGSKRIPGKNLLEFFGKSLLERAIEIAQDSELFDVIHVSTDDPKISETAAAAGQRPDFKRASGLSDDITPVLPVLVSVINQYADMGRPVEEVTLLYPCAPLLRGDDLRAGYEIFTSGGQQTPVVAVGTLPIPLERAFQMNGDGLLVPADPEGFLSRSQDLPESYQDAGAFAIFTVDQLRAHSAGKGGGFRPYVLPRERCVDIDSPEDVKLAKILFKGLDDSPIKTSR